MIFSFLKVGTFTKKWVPKSIPLIKDLVYYEVNVENVVKYSKPLENL